MKKHTKLQPSKRLAAQLQSFLSSQSKSMVDDLIRHGAELTLQQALEVEADEFLGRAWYEHHGDRSDPHRGYRNGYYGRRVKSPVGPLLPQQPRLRAIGERFRSGILGVGRTLGQTLTRLGLEMYVRGLSTRDIEQTLVNPDGSAVLSKSAVSRLSERLWEEYQEWSSRSLAELDIVYLFCDGVYESVKHYTNDQPILCAWGIASDGRRHLLDMKPVASESTQAWNDFFEGMLARGLRQPLLVISDGGGGVKAAIALSFPKSRRQRCIAHKLRNLMAKLPTEVRQAVLQEVRGVYYAADYKTAETLAAILVTKYGAVYPEMIKCFQDDLPACLEHLRFPASHRRYIRTTNLIERSFGEQKRRTKVMGPHAHERGALAIVFGVMIRVDRLWRRIEMTELQRAELRTLRFTMGVREDSEYISFRRAA